MDFISLPVTAGFVSAAAINVISYMLPTLLGIKMDASTVSFIECWKTIFKEFEMIRCGDTLTGIVSIVLLVSLKSTEEFTICTRLFHFLAKARYLILIVTGTLVAYFYHTSSKETPFSITGSIIEGHVPFIVPQFYTIEGNQTVTFIDMVESIGLRIVIIPLISILQLFVVSKVFSVGEHIHVNQELMTLGLINICGSFVTAMPSTGSFARTAVNIASGVRSPFSGLLTPITVLIAVYYWSDSFFYIPNAVLSGMIIVIMWPLIDVHMPIELWNTKSKILMYLNNHNSQ